MSPHASIVRQRQLSRWRVSPLPPARTSENEWVAPFGVALLDRFSFLALCALIRVPVGPHPEAVAAVASCSSGVVLLKD